MGVVYRAEDAPAKTRLDYLSHVLSDRVLPLEVELATDVDPRTWTILTGDIGALRITRATQPWAGACSRAPRLIRRSDPDHYGIAVVTRGRMLVDHDGSRCRLGPGDFAFFDPSRPFRNEHPEVQLTAVMFPRGMLPLRSTEIGRLTGARFPGDDGVSALVSTLLGRLPRHLDDSRVAMGTRLGTTLLDLLAVALADRLGQAGGPSADARQRTLLPRIDAFIEEHLTDPELTPNAVAAAHHISVRYLYKLYQAQGRTVSGWIRWRRLERCRYDLLDPALATRSIGATARRWGFTDDAHFSRAFRAAYGLPPGEYRRTFAGPPPREPTGAPETW